MAWDVSDDPVDFDEAIEWFRKRVPMTKAERERAAATQKSHAFTIAGVSQLDLVNHAWKAIDAAIAKGTTLEEFKKTVGGSLARAWSGSVENPAWRLETIFRTNLQSAYSSGRYKQAIDPAVVSDRPVWMFDAILDGRETPICRDCDGTKRPADDPWWQTHQPPLHFNCRSSFITLTEKQAGKITLHPPTTKPDDGFGGTPGSEAFANAREPDLSEYPKELKEAFVAKEAAKPPPPPPATFDPKVHAKEFISKSLKGAELEHLFAGVKDAGVLTYLEANPLKKLVIEPSAKGRKNKVVNGWYADGPFFQLRVSSKRPKSSYNNGTLPNAHSVSSTAKTAEEARRRTFIHELGHHVHLGPADKAANDVVEKAYAAALKRKVFVSKYAGTEPAEYFAESFAAYFSERSALAKADPDGLAMVEEVLRLRGIQ